MRRFFSPGWVTAHFLILTFALVMVNLGSWQLRRHDEVSQQNQIGAARLRQAPLDLSEMVAAAGQDHDTLEYRPTQTAGFYEQEREMLLRSQVRNGVPGFSVITPLLLADGRGVLVDRGWVPVSVEAPPVLDAPPPSGEVEVSGIVRASQTRGALGRLDPEGSAILSRVDLELIQRSLPYALLPVYIQIIADGGGSEGSRSFPLAADRPEFVDNGNHFSYAIQWFSFSAVLVVGYGFLIRSRARKKPTHRSS